MPSNFWNQKRVLVTGGTGFIGVNLTNRLLDLGANVSITTSRPETGVRASFPANVNILSCDLLSPTAAKQAAQGQEIVFHLAARVGGVEYNMQHPASIFSINMQLALNVMEACHKSGIDRMVVASTACVYPHICSVPTPEEEGFTGIPEFAHEGHGWSKRMEEFLGAAYAREYGLKVAIGRLYNIYGPGDHFHMESAGVIPSLIKKVFDPKGKIVIWGDGTQSRSFLYVKDCVRGLLDLAEKHPIPEATNIWASEEITIRDLAKIIIKISGKKVEIEFDTDRPSGQLRRICDTRKAEKLLGYKATTTLQYGLTETIKWYCSQYERTSI